jgi:hypothetical protein
MADKKITELPVVLLAGIDPSVDVFPVVTAADGITKQSTIAAAVLSVVSSLSPSGVVSVNSRTGNVVLTKSDVSLSNVDNTSDVNKPVSTATQTALNAKQDTLVSATNIKTINGTSLLGSGDLSAGMSLVLSTRTSNTILGTADKGTLVDVTTAGFTQTFTAAATLGSGWFVYLRNSSTTDLTLDPNGAETIDGLTSYIMYPGEVRLVQCNGTAFTSVILCSLNRIYTTSGNFTVPPGYSRLVVDAIGAGAGGNAGTTGNNFSGGGGGGGGRSLTAIIPPTAGTVVTVTIGAGGPGGASSGLLGTSGGNSTFGTYASGIGGAAGGSASTGGVGGGNISSIPYTATSSSRVGLTGGASAGSNTAGGNAEWGGASGGSGDTTLNASGFAGGGSLFAAGGGGSGSYGNTTQTGGAGGASGAYSTGGGGAGGVGAAGSNGADGANGLCGSGGGGGGNTAAAAFAGGNGGAPGGGGGGGGATPTLAGAGGTGGRGEIRITGVF